MIGNDHLTSEYRLADEYRQPARLATRIGFYDRFRVAGEPWQDWLLRRVLPAGGARVADFGCGTGGLWASRPLPPGTRVTMVDKFPDMLAAARSALGEDPRFTLHCADLEAGDLPIGTYDCILAAHLVYHLVDIGRFVRRARDQLVPRGRLVVTIPSPDHIREIYDLLEQVGVARDQHIQACSEETQGAMLATFASNAVEEYVAELIVDNAAALSAFVVSFRAIHRGALDDERRRLDFEAVVAARIAQGADGRPGVRVHSRNLVFTGEAGP